MIRKGSVTEELLEILCAPEPTDVLERLEAESVEEPSAMDAYGLRHPHL